MSCTYCRGRSSTGPSGEPGDVSLAFGGTHTDPGPSFSIDFYLALVGAAAAAA